MIGSCTLSLLLALKCLLLYTWCTSLGLYTSGMDGPLNGTGVNLFISWDICRTGSLLPFPEEQAVYQVALLPWCA